MNGGAHMFIGAASVVALNYYYPFLPSGWIPLGMAVGAGVLVSTSRSTPRSTSWRWATATSW